MKLKISGVILFIVIIFCSCKSKEERTIDDLTAAIRKCIEDQAFKMNQKVTLLEITNVTYTIVGQNSIDSFRSAKIQMKLSQYKKLRDGYISIAKSKLKLMKLYSELGNRTLIDAARDDTKEYIDTVNLYNDSLKYYARYDSLLIARIEINRNESKDFYKTKFLCKGTIAGDNLLDTLILVFDKKYQLIDLNKI